MKKLLVIIFLISLIINFTSLIFLPDQLAIHFGSSGYPDNWSSKYFHCLLFIIIFTGFFLLYYFIPIIIIKIPHKYINLPNRKYWLDEKYYQLNKNKISSMLYEMGISLFVFFLLVYFLVAKANLSDPVKLPVYLFLPILIAYLLYILIWLVRFFVYFMRSTPPEN